MARLQAPASPSPGVSSRLMRALSNVVMRDLVLKLVALFITAVLFVVTRDQVTRTFEVPLRVVEDPDRILLTDVPESVNVLVRGPWTQINLLDAYDLGEATLDLREAKPGPLAVERGSIVMPDGVLLADVKYDPVDLRFDAVERRRLPVRVDIVGEVHPDYELTSVSATPRSWVVRGGVSHLDDIDEVQTMPVTVDSVAEAFTTVVPLLPPSEHTHLVEIEDDAVPEVRVRVVVEPRIDEKTFDVPVEAPDELDPNGLIPSAYQVRARGPRPAFRRLDDLALSFVIAAQVKVVPTEDPAGTKTVDVHFEWVGEVPGDIQQALTLEDTVHRVVLPPPPRPVQPEPPPVQPDLR